MQGWVSFHRQIMKWEWYKDSNTFRLFFHLVLNANHEKGRWKGIEIERGQHLTSSEKLAEQLDLSRQQIRTSLKKLERTQEITIKSTNKFTVVTVVKYDLYQDDKRKVTSKSTNEQPISNQQVTTNNNEDKKKKKNTTIFTPPTIEEVQAYIKDKGYGVDAKYFYEFYDSSNWIKANGNKIVSWKQTVVTWNNRNKKKEQEKPKLKVLAGASAGNVLTVGATERW